MNLGQCLSQAQLVCKDTALDPALVAAMQILGLVIVQIALLAGSRISRFAIATPDITVGMLCAGAVARGAIGQHVEDPRRRGDLHDGQRRRGDAPGRLRLGARAVAAVRGGHLRGH